MSPEVDPTTFLAWATVSIATVTGILALFTLLSVLSIRTQTTMNFWISQLDRLYHPMHDEIVRRGRDLDAIWALRTRGFHSAWDAVAALMAAYGYLGSIELQTLYERIVRPGARKPDKGEIERRQQEQSKLIREFAIRAEKEYDRLRSELKRVSKT